MDTSDLSNAAARPPGTSAGAAWSGLPLPLRECGEISVLRLSSALSDALSQTAEQLFKEATEAVTAHEREAFVEAAEFARNHRRGMVYDFMKHFELRYLRACQRKSSHLLGHSIDFDVKELKIVEHHVLDDSLAPGKIAEAIQNSCWKTLQMLTSQFRDLLDDQDLLPNDIPLGPKTIEAAVSDAIRDQPWRHAAKQRLAQSLRWPLAARVNLLYRDLVDHLSTRDLKAFATPQALTSAQEIKPPPVTEKQAPKMAQTRVHAPSPTPSPTPSASDIVVPTKPEPVESMEEVAAMEAEADASTAAWDEVARCLEDPGMPRIVADFLSNHWRRLLTVIHAQFGPDSTPWRDAVRTMDELAWSLAAKPTQEDCLRLTEGMPYLMQSLSNGMDALKLPQEARNALLVFLAQRHADLVRYSMAQVQAPPRAAAVPPPEDVKPPETWLKDLKVGTWLEFREPGGEVKELKLAWVSPHKSLFLLTNRQGERALSLPAADFAKILLEGQARISQTANASPKGEGIAPGNSRKKTA